MSKAVGAVTKTVGGVVGSITGGGGSPGILGTGRFKAETRDIDKGAFKIEESKEAAKRAKEREKESEDRSKQAQQQRQTLISQLQAQAAGEAPSLAEAQLKSASERSLAQQLAAAQAQRGGSAAARERGLRRGQAEAGRSLAQQSTEARLQERESAQRLLGEQVTQEQQLADQLTQNYLSQGFNIEQARQQAQADFEKLETDQFLAAQGANLSGFQSSAQLRAQVTGGLLSGLGSALGLSDINSKKNIKKAKGNDMKNLSNEPKKKDIEKIEVKGKDSKKDEEEKDKKFKKIFSKGDTGATKAGKTMGFAFGKGLKGLFGKDKPETSAKKEEEKSEEEEEKSKSSRLSDKMSKKAYSDKNIKKDFLDKLEAYTYEYKNKYKDDPRAGEGRHMSVMAQDLEKAGPIGKSMVEEDSEGVKMVDYAKGYGAILAAQAHLNKRLNELENKSKKRK